MEIRTSDAIIVVDVQRDFCPGGTLAVAEGDAVVAVANRIVPLFRERVFTRDWHPTNHCSFSSEPRFTDMSWPMHCVANTPGAAFHPGLALPPDALYIEKATRTDKDAYSGFDETALTDTLRARHVERVFVCGLATDYCVKATAIDAKNAGFGVVVVTDACRAVDVPPGSGERAIADMRAAGIEFCVSESLSP